MSVGRLRMLDCKNFRNNCFDFDPKTNKRENKSKTVRKEQNSLRILKIHISQAVSDIFHCLHKRVHVRLGAVGPH